MRFKITKLIKDLFKPKRVYEVGQVWKCSNDYSVTITAVGRIYLGYEDTMGAIKGSITKDFADTWLISILQKPTS